jgi:hypothetical protein
MRRILLDENVPVGVRDQLAGFSVATVSQMGWAEMSNGKLLVAAEKAGFDAIVTADQNPHQNDLHRNRLAVIVLGTTHWPTIRANPRPMREAVERATTGSYTVVTFPNLRARRRPPTRNEKP